MPTNLQRRARARAAIKIKLVANLGQTGRAIRLDHRRDHTDLPVTIQILMETALKRFQCNAAARHHADIRDVVAVVVGGPHRILISPRALPGDLIAGRRLLRGNRRPGAGYARHAGQMAGAENLQQRRNRTRTVIKIILIANLR